MAESRYIVFRLHDEAYSIDLMFVKEIEENYTVIPIPNCPPHIKGIINLRGEVVPVYSLRSRFGLEENTAACKLILTYIHGYVIGFEVDSIQGIEDVSQEDRLPTPKLICSEDTTYIDCIIHASSGIAVNISVENILSENEVRTLAEHLSEDE